MSVIFPVQIQASNTDAKEAFKVVMVHAFDTISEMQTFAALCRTFLHVVSWDVNGTLVNEYDNR